MLTPTPAAPSGEQIDKLLEAHAKAVILVHEHGESSGYYSSVVAAEEAIRAAVSQAAPEQATGTMVAELQTIIEAIRNGAQFWPEGWRGTAPNCDRALKLLGALAAPSGAPKQPTIDLNELSIRTLRETYIAAFGPLPAEYTSDLIDYDIIELIKQAAASTVQSAPVLPAAGLNEREAFEKHAAALGMPLNGHGGHYANIRTRNMWLGWQARAAQSTPVQVEGQQEQTLQPSCDSALHAEPASQHKIPEPGYSDSLADRVFNLPCNWKGDQRLFDAILMGHCMACEQAYDLVWTHEQTRSAGSARQGGEHAPEIVQAGALPVAAAPEQKP